MSRRKQNRTRVVKRVDTAPSQLRSAYGDFVNEVALARVDAERKAYAGKTSVYEHLDLSRALDVLNANPPLMSYLQTVVERRQAIEEVKDGDTAVGSRRFGVDTLKATGPTSEVGAAGSGASMSLRKPLTRDSTDSVPNAELLRAWSEQVEWVRAAINIRREQVGRASIVVRPIDPKRPHNIKVRAVVEALLEEPNEYRDSLRTIIESAVEDILVLDRGVIEKNMTPARVPTAIYASDGALFKIYTGWSGNPDEPRYLYDDPLLRTKIPLRNDEVILMCANPATYRSGLSPVQVLRKAIISDIKATESAMHVVDGKPPQHIVQLPKASKTQVSKVRDTYDQEVAGQRNLMFVGGEEPIHLYPLMFSAKDNQWMEWQQYIVLKIATIFQISPQQLGQTININKANGEIQEKIYEDTGLIPLMLLVEEFLNRELLADFAPKRPDGRPDYLSLNLQIVFPTVSEADRILHVERMVSMSKDLLGGNMPSATLNQVLMMRGEEPVEGGDAFWVYSTKAGQTAWLSYDPNFDWLAANGLNPDGSRAAVPMAPVTPQAAAADDAALNEVDDDKAAVNEGKTPKSAPAAKPTAPAEPPPESPPPAPATPPPASPAKAFWSPTVDGRRAGQRWSVSLQREANQRHEPPSDSFRRAQQVARLAEPQIERAASPTPNRPGNLHPVSKSRLDKGVQIAGLQAAIDTGASAVQAVFDEKVKQAKAEFAKKRERADKSLSASELTDLTNLFNFGDLDEYSLYDAILSTLTEAYIAAYKAHAAAIHAVLPSNWTPSATVLANLAKEAQSDTDSIVLSYVNSLDRLNAELQGDDSLDDIDMAMSAAGASVTGYGQWKSKETSKTEASKGADVAAEDFADEVELGVIAVEHEEAGKKLVVAILPGGPTDTVCAQWAGMYITIDNRDELPSFPLHPNCDHTKHIEQLSDVEGDA